MNSASGTFSPSSEEGPRNFPSFPSGEPFSFQGEGPVPFSKRGTLRLSLRRYSLQHRGTRRPLQCRLCVNGCHLHGEGEGCYTPSPHQKKVPKGTLCWGIPSFLKAGISPLFPDCFQTENPPSLLEFKSFRSHTLQQQRKSQY
jgi:hypothetical protein